MSFFKVPVTHFKIIVWLCLLLIPFSCQKENLEQPNPLILPEAKIAAAKTWFDENISQNQPSVLKKGRNHKKNALWQKAVSQLVATQEAVVVPLDYQDEIVGVSSEKKLLLYKQDKGYKIEVAIILPDPAYLVRKNFKYDASDFTGRILVLDWNDTFLRGYSFTNGKQTATLSQSEPNTQKTNTGKTAMTTVCSTVTVPHYTQVCYTVENVTTCSDWTYSYSDTYQECVSFDSGSSGGGGNSGGGSSGGATPGGGVPPVGGSSSVPDYNFHFPANPRDGQMYVYKDSQGKSHVFTYDATLKIWTFPVIDVKGTPPSNPTQGTVYIYIDPITNISTRYIYAFTGDAYMDWSIQVSPTPTIINFPPNPSDGEIFVSQDNLGNEIIYTYNGQDNTWRTGTGLPEFSVTDPSSGGQDLTVDKLRAIAKDNGYDFDIGNNYKVISEVFERAFMNCAVFTINGVTSSYVEYNDSPEKNVSGKVIPFQNSVRPNKPVQPDGLGPTGTRNKSTLKPEQSTYVPNSAFYEVKSGQTTLDLHYSPSNPDQLFAMLDALTRTRAHALKNATLFLVTCKGVRVADDLIDQARLMGVNLVQITPTIYPDNTVSFENARFLHRVPRGWLEDLGANIETFFIKRFTTPVPLLWNVHSGTDQTFEGD